VAAAFQGRTCSRTRFSLSGLIFPQLAEVKRRQAEQAAEKRPCSVILSEAKNLSSI
jgi:hypothetical protein